MPSINPLSAFDSARNFVNIVKEVNFDDVKQRAEDMPRMLFVGLDQTDAEDAAALMVGENNLARVDIRAGELVQDIDVSRFDLVVVTDPGHTGLFEKVRGRSGESHRDRVFYLPDTTPEIVDRVRLEIVLIDPELAPSLGRHFELFRAAAIHAIIDSTSKANAKFALISNVPAVIPILGGFVSAGADLIVLTKNQVMMSYKLAAANGRGLDDQAALIRELAPVVGAGFVWRTVAREATSFLPFLAGTLPKVGIAFVGTYTVGRAVDYYYRFGQKPPKDQLEMFRKQAVKLAASVPFLGREGSKVREDEIEAAIKASVLESTAKKES